LIVATKVLQQGFESEKVEFRDGAVNVLRGGGGPPLLLLHGFKGAGQWLPFHTQLAQHFEVYAPDHPGFGETDDLPSVEAMEDLVYHNLDLMDRLGLEHAYLVGASLGGWLAAELATHSPHRFHKLVILSPLGHRIPGHPIADFFGMDSDEQTAALFYDSDVAEAVFPEESDIDAILRSYRDLSGFARFAWAPFMGNPKLERRLHRITVPTLVQWAEEDRIVPRSHAEKYAQLIPAARLETIPQCGHALYLEQPEGIAQSIISFLGGSEEPTK
jgi:pimeloyl-ACP methyl ester carboxylesterase